MPVWLCAKSSKSCVDSYTIWQEKARFCPSICSCLHLSCFISPFLSANRSPCCFVSVNCDASLFLSAIRSLRAPIISRLLAVATENHAPHPLDDVAKKRVVGAVDADGSLHVKAKIAPVYIFEVAVKGVPGHGMQRPQQHQVKLRRMSVHAFPGNEHLTPEVGLKVAEAERPRGERQNLSGAHEFARDEVAVVAFAVDPDSKAPKPRSFGRLVELVEHVVDIFDVRLQKHDVTRQVVVV